MLCLHNGDCKGASRSRNCTMARCGSFAVRSFPVFEILLLPLMACYATRSACVTGAFCADTGCSSVTGFKFELAGRAASAAAEVCTKRRSQSTQGEKIEATCIVPSSLVSRMHRAGKHRLRSISLRPKRAQEGGPESRVCIGRRRKVL